MRRSDKEVTDYKEIAAIMQKAEVCWVALADGNHPYIIPVNFVVQDNNLYFHSGRAGRKIDILRKNSQVCFAMDIDTEIVKGDTPCAWGAKYRSVIGFGQAFFIEETEDKKKVLNYLMEKYSGPGSFSYNEDSLEKVLVVGIRIEKIAGKKSGC